MMSGGAASQNSQHQRVMELKYQSKYRKLKQTIKDMVLENAALCDENSQVQADLMWAREDRRFLIKRLLTHEKALRQQHKEEQEQEQLEEQQAETTTIGEKPMMPPPTAPPPRRKQTLKQKKLQQQLSPKTHTLQAPRRGRLPKAIKQQMQGMQMLQQPVKQKKATQANARKSQGTKTAAAASAFMPRKRGPKKQQKANSGKPSQQTAAAAQQLAKMPAKPTPKRQLQTAAKRMRVRDKLMLDDNGKPMFPINLCSILIHAPGEIVPANPSFHNAHWIYPVGYVSTRVYAHPKDAMRKCVYTCKILNNAGKPQFQIIPDNDLESVYFGETPNYCHQQLLESLQRTLVGIAKLPIHVQGEKFFGLANPTIKYLLQMDSGYKFCANFEGFQELPTAIFVEDDKDPTMNFEALQMLISLSPFHMMPEVRAEPPDELLSMC